MKKIVFILSIILGFTTLISCKKDYKCICVSNTPDIHFTKTIQISAKEDEAKTKCKEQESTFGFGVVCVIE